MNNKRIEIGSRVRIEVSCTRHNNGVITHEYGEATVKEVKTINDCTLYKCVHDELHPVWGECYDWLTADEIEGVI